MSKNRYINTAFWDDAYTSNLDPIEKLLFLYFLTNPLTNLTGIYEISLKRIAFDTGIDKEMILKILERFAKEKKMFYGHNFIYIPNFIKHQNQNSPKIKSAIKRQISEIPDFVKKFISETEYGIDTVSHFNSNINSNINSNSNLNLDIFPQKKIKKNPVGKITDENKTKISENPVIKNSHSECVKYFDSFYFDTKKIKYDWTEKKEFKNLQQLLKKLYKQIILKNPDANETDLINAFKYFVSKNPDSWINDNLSISILNSKFNQILNKIKNGQTANTNGKGFSITRNSWIAEINYNELQSSGIKTDKN